MMTRPQAEALATFVNRIRPDWDHPGIVAAIGKASTLGSPAQIGRALCALAENPDLRSPALLSSPGRHWTQDGVQTGANVSHNIPCPVHPINNMPCPLCAAKKCPPDPVEHADYLAEKKKLADRKTADRAVAQKRLTDFESAKEATS